MESGATTRTVSLVRSVYVRVRQDGGGRSESKAAVLLGHTLQKDLLMLVLSRKKDEWVDIGGGIHAGGVSFVIVEIRGDKVRIGIAAPKDIKVDRREITELIAAEKGGVE